MALVVSADATLTSSETTSDSSFDFFSSFGLDSFDVDAARPEVEADVDVDDDDKAGNVSEENGDCVELFSTFDLSS